MRAFIAMRDETRTRFGCAKPMAAIVETHGNEVLLRAVDVEQPGWRHREGLVFPRDKWFWDTRRQSPFLRRDSLQRDASPASKIGLPPLAMMKPVSYTHLTLPTILRV